MVRKKEAPKTVKRGRGRPKKEKKEEVIETAVVAEAKPEAVSAEQISEVASVQRKRYNTPEELDARINEYFGQCHYYGRVVSE